MARSSTDRLPRPGAALALGLWASAVLHVAVLAWACRDPVSVAVPAVSSRPLTVRWVSPVAPLPVKAQACAGACGSAVRRDERPGAVVTPALPAATAPVVSVASEAAAPPMAEAASAPAVGVAGVAGVAFAPPRWGGFAPSRWGRPPVASSTADDESARLARQQAQRLAAQQQQAMAEMAWRTRADMAAARPISDASTQSSP